MLMVEDEAAVEALFQDSLIKVKKIVENYKSQLEDVPKMSNTTNAILNHSLVLYTAPNLSLINAKAEDFSGSYEERYAECRRKLFEMVGVQPQNNTSKASQDENGGSEQLQQQKQQSNAYVADDDMFASSSIKAEFYVPSNKAGLVIGHGGETLRRLEALSGTKIQFDMQQNPNETEKRIIITGTLENIEKAKEAILDKIGANIPSFSMKVPASKVGLIIGRKGDTIRELKEKSNARIEVLQGPEYSHGPDRFVSIAGDPSAVEKAKELIEEIIGGSSASEDIRITVQMPEESVKYLIGKGGATLRSIHEATQANVSLDTSTLVPGYKNVFICGSTEAVINAQASIYEVTGVMAPIVDSPSGFLGWGGLSQQMDQYAATAQQQIPGTAEAANMDAATQEQYAAYYAAYYASMAQPNVTGEDPSNSGAVATEMDPETAKYWQEYYANYYASYYNTSSADPSAAAATFYPQPPGEQPEQPPGSV